MSSPSLLDSNEDYGIFYSSDDEISIEPNLHASSRRHDPDNNVSNSKEIVTCEKNEQWERITDSSFTSSSEDEDSQEKSNLDRCLFYHRSHKSEGEMKSLIASLISFSTSPSSLDSNAFRPRSNTLPTNNSTLPPSLPCPVIRPEGNCLPLLPLSKFSSNEKSEKRKQRRRPLTLLPSLKPWGSFSSLANFLYSEKYSEDELVMIDGDLPTSESDLSPRVISVKRESEDGTNFQYIKCRSFHLITTAALPWMTGTSVNPTLRACYLNQMNRNAIETLTSNRQSSSPWECMGTVTLVMPWLIDQKDRQELYGLKIFNSTFEQELYIRSWIRDVAKLPLEADIQTHGIRILFYPARYSKQLGSIFALGDICNLIDDTDADCCILEEPEHLNWMRPTETPLWTEKFKYVVGIIHTNYTAYAKTHLSGLISSPFIGSLSSVMARVHCHRIIKLSSCLQSFAHEKEVVCNTHGIRSEFLIPPSSHQFFNSISTNIHLGNDITSSRHVFTTDHVIRQQMNGNDSSIYFIGKLLWAKGLDKLLHLEYSYKKATGNFFKLNIYGCGPDEIEIKRAFYGSQDEMERISASEETFTQEAIFLREKIVRGIDSFISDLPSLRYDWKRAPIPCEFHGRIDHAELKGHHQIFVNPSITEVLCTTTAEALAMNNFIIIPHHPSNLFFEDFPNCLVYRTTLEFISQLQYALSHQPINLPKEWADKLSWETATSRFISASITTRRDSCKAHRLGAAKADVKAAKWLRSTLAGSKGDIIRTMIGGRDVGEQYQYTLKGKEIERELLGELPTTFRKNSY